MFIVTFHFVSLVVELLIVAHDCFSLTCNMEGIVRVLQVARHMSHAHLAPGLHNGLLVALQEVQEKKKKFLNSPDTHSFLSVWLSRSQVRLLTGIARYNEMTYIFDILHQSHSFEALLRKKLDTGKGQVSALNKATTIM